jgi:DNA modification methylase
MDRIKIEDVVIVESRQRRLRRWQVERIASKMQEKGFNVSYPITLEMDGQSLIDGGHRLAAAKEAGIESVPFIVTDEDPIAHSIRCNSDGEDTESHDVFDLAVLCSNMSNDGMTGAEIAQRLGWSTAPMVTYHKQIKERLHPRCFDLATGELNKNDNLFNSIDDDSFNPQLNKFNWRVTHLMEIVSEIPYTDRASYRAQWRVISQILELADNDKKITAAKIAKIAKRESWHAQLGRVIRDELLQDVPLRDWIRLWHSVRHGVFGDKQDDEDLSKIKQAIAALNERATGVKLYCDDAAKRIPQLDDNSIALVVTDPPYNVTDYDWDDKGTPDEYVQWLIGILELLKPKLKQDYHLFMFCAPQHEAVIEIALRNAGWPIKSKVIWEYRNLVQGRDVKDKFIVNYQPCFHIGTHALNWSPEWSDKRFAVQNHAAPQSNFKDGKDHPHQKPIELIELFVKIGSSPGDIVIDMFAGSGTTGTACNNLGARRCVLIEQDDDYCSVIERKLKIRRISEWQG